MLFWMMPHLRNVEHRPCTAAAGWIQEKPQTWAPWTNLRLMVFERRLGQKYKMLTSCTTLLSSLGSCLRTKGFAKLGEQVLLRNSSRTAGQSVKSVGNLGLKN